MRRPARSSGCTGCSARSSSTRCASSPAAPAACWWTSSPCRGATSRTWCWTASRTSPSPSAGGEMRLVFLALLLANAAFFAWSRHSAPDKTAADANPLARQVEPEKLKIVPPGELRPPPPAPKPAAAAAPLVACLEWGSFTVSDYPRAEKALEPLALGGRLAQRRTEEVAGWWVHMPPQGSRQAALRKSGELKALGVQDYFIVAEDGEWRWALSLGVYRTE